MERRKIVITLFTILVLSFLMVGKSFAANSYSATLTPNNSKVSKGSEVKVTLKLSGIKVDGGLNSLIGTLKFDADILTFVEVQGLNGWSATYNEDNNKVAIDSGDATTEDKEIATFTFKVSESTSASTAALQFVNISGGNSSLDQEETISDVTTNIGITNSIAPSPSDNGDDNSGDDNTPTESPSTNNTSNNTTNNTANNTNNKTSNNTSNSLVNNEGENLSNGTTTKNEAMPYTGAETFVIPMLAVIAALAIVSYVNYKKIDKKY